MRFSVWPWLSTTWPELSALVRHVEATGWDGVYVADHFMADEGGGFGAVTDPLLEATATLAALAGETERVRLATLVLGMTYRHPAVLANWAATVDHASGGRLLLGVGAGWQENEHHQYGIELGSVRERVDRFEEGVAVLTGLLNDARTTMAGRHYVVTDALCEPKPLQQPAPLLIGAKGDRMLGLVARHATEWNVWSTPESNAERWAVLERHCERIDRDPATIARSTQAVVIVTETDASETERAIAERLAPRPVLVGTPGRIAEQVHAYGDAGVAELIVPDFALGTGTERTDRLDGLIEAFAPLRG
jgi:alkanesulfonate monooxygenase SsuD/methylene tetrahydromethanopterin reductase-like flavin-dependent oxidoreductase (luciferase family)